MINSSEHEAGGTDYKYDDEYHNLDDDKAYNVSLGIDRPLRNYHPILTIPVRPE